jgi:hypothetical protein
VLVEVFKFSSRFAAQVSREPLGRNERDMNIPEKVELDATCAEQCDLSGIVFCVRLFSGTKNPYTIIFPKTDARGRAELSAEDVRGQYTDHKETFPMDYNGTIEDASQEVELFLFNVARLKNIKRFSLAWPLASHERTRWKSRKEWYAYHASARSDEFSFPPIRVELVSTRKIEGLVVQRR